MAAFPCAKRCQLSLGDLRTGNGLPLHRTSREARHAGQALVAAGYVVGTAVTCLVATWGAVVVTRRLTGAGR